MIGKESLEHWFDSQTLKINAFFFGDEWAVLDNRMDRPHIFSDDPKRNELYRPKKEKSDHGWCEAKLELVPEDELGDQVAEPGEKTEEGEYKPAKDHEAERNLG